MAFHSLKVSIKNCDQIAADRRCWQPAGSSSAPYDSTLYDLPFSHNTTRLGSGIP